MNAKIDAKIVGQLHQIKNMESFVGWLRAERELVRDNLEGLSGESYFRAQGRAQCLKELLSYIENAQEIARKIK